MRCYLLRKGQFAAVELLSGESDQAAVDQAQALFTESKNDFIDGFEVWDGERFVYRYPEQPPRYVCASPVESFYHLKLFTDDRAICGSFAFSAKSDEAAYEIAEAAFDACSDRATAFEVRDGSRLINPTVRLITMLDQVMANRQAQLVALEERMRDSRWAVAKSERLLARLKDSMTPLVAADHHTAL